MKSHYSFEDCDTYWQTESISECILKGFSNGIRVYDTPTKAEN